MSQKSHDAQAPQPRHPEAVTMPPGGGAAVALARRIYLSATPTRNWRVVADRMFRALSGVSVAPFPLRKGIPGLPKNASSKE